MKVAIRACLAIALSWLAGVSHADALVAANGDRLQGKLISENDGVTVFDSERLGRIEVRAGQAKVAPAPRQESREWVSEWRWDFGWRFGPGEKD